MAGSLDQNLYYRADPDDQSPIEVVVMIPGRPPMRGRVIDVYVDGIGVRLPRSTVLPLGLDVEVGLKVPHAPRPIALSAMVRARKEGRSFRRYTLRFVSRDEIDEKIPQGLYSIFNRRRAERYYLSEKLAIAVVPDGRFETLPAKLGDVSLVGASVLVGPKVERVLATSERLQLVLETAALATLGEVSEALVLDVIVHNRLLLDGSIRYGCEFNPSAAGSDDKAQRLVALVMSHEGSRLA